MPIKCCAILTDDSDDIAIHLLAPQSEAKFEGSPEI